MAQAHASEVFNCSVSNFYKILTDYEKYPQFLSEVKACHVVEEKEGRKLVEYEISLIKTFTYSLWMSEQNAVSLVWEFAHGDIFKHMSGAWKLSDEAGKTRADYSIDAKFGLFVPGPIAKGIIEVNLPNMMGSYHKRVKELYG